MKLFRRNNVEYQFDALTSAFIHKVEFVMDDIDHDNFNWRSSPCAALPQCLWL